LGEGFGGVAESVSPSAPAARERVSPRAIAISRAVRFKFKRDALSILRAVSFISNWRARGELGLVDDPTSPLRRAA
jgi:hypothetical protein